MIRFSIRRRASASSGIHLLWLRLSLALVIVYQNAMRLVYPESVPMDNKINLCNVKCKVILQSMVYPLEVCIGSDWTFIIRQLPNV
jgi:hypothetical protein